MEIKKEKLFILDDKPTILEILKEFLDEFGYETTTFTSGTKALEEITESTAIVITDIKMPGMSGLDVLRKVKEKSPQTEVILMTGYASMESAVEALNLGAYCYLRKPFNFDEVRVFIDKALERRSLRLKNEKLLKNLSILNGELEGKVEELRITNEELKRTQGSLIEKEKLETKARIVVSLNHEIIGRVQAIIAGTGYLKNLPADGGKSDLAGEINKIEAEAIEISNIIKNLEEMEEFKVVPYVNGVEMMDLDDQPKKASDSTP